MAKLDPNDICNLLASRADGDYKFVKFKGCLFNASTNELISTFLYEESIKGKISGMKAQLEQEFKAAVTASLRGASATKQSQTDPQVNFLFLYKQCYMDTGRLEILIQEFLRKNFSFLTLDLSDKDLIVTKGEEGFTSKLRLTKQTADYIRGSKSFKTFAEDLAQNNFALFKFVFEEKADDEKVELTLEDIEKFAEEKIYANIADKIDKVCQISNREYLLGAPIKERPIKIEFLRVGPEEQIIAGSISFLTKREYTKRDSPSRGEGVAARAVEPARVADGVVEQKVPYWTFVLDDGSRKQSCVYFLSGRTDEIIQKNISKMGTLENGKSICVTGINNERNGRVNFVVRGISLCELL